MNSNVPLRNSSTATSAGAPILSVPRSLKASNARAALTVAQAITWLNDMPNIRNFDITFGKSTTPGLLRDIAFQSVERVSGQKPCFVARSTISQLKCPPPPLPKTKITPRRRAAVTSGKRRPWSSRMLFGGGAYMWETISPRLSRARIARIGEKFWPTWIITGRPKGPAAAWARLSASRSLVPATLFDNRAGRLDFTHAPFPQYAQLAAALRLT